MELFGIAVVIILQVVILLQLKGERKVMATAAQALQDLQDAVAQDTSVDTSAVTLIQQLAVLVQQANGVSPDAVEALVAQLKSNAGGLASAVTAGTPAAPAPPPATT